MEKRNTRTYKIKDKPYNKAKKKAGGKLSTMIEGWVTEYGNGAQVQFVTFASSLPSVINMPPIKPINTVKK